MLYGQSELLQQGNLIVEVVHLRRRLQSARFCLDLLLAFSLN